MIKNKLVKNSKKVDKFLINHLHKQERSLLINPMKYGVISGGKKIRTTIILDAGKIFKINQKKLINICAAVECIHSYSLIHDDLPCMDNDKFRRGKPSAHIKFGEAKAILTGDALQALAYEVICDDKKLDSDNKIKAIKLISNACGKNGMVLGQHLDIDSESKSYRVEGASTNDLVYGQVHKYTSLSDDDILSENKESVGSGYIQSINSGNDIKYDFNQKGWKKNITVNCVSPGFIKSEMTKQISEEHTELLKSRISLNKFGNAEDVANTIAFLSSNMSDYITGETIHVNGGMYFS